MANVAGGFAFLFCFSVFSIQLFNLLKSWVSPTTTNTYVEEVPLENMDFPLDIILCVRPGMKTEALGDLGYRDATSFSMGASMFNQSLVGWGGHDDKGKGLKSAKEVLNLVRPSWTEKLPVLTKNLSLDHQFPECRGYNSSKLFPMLTNPIKLS